MMSDLEVKINNGVLTIGSMLINVGIAVEHGGLSKAEMKLIWEYTLKLEAENAQLQKERDECNEDLICTQKTLSELETKYESISLMFCESDGNPIFEPFNAENLSIWLKQRDLEQQSKGATDYNGTLREAAKKASDYGFWLEAMSINDCLDNEFERFIDPLNTKIEQLKEQG